MAFSNMYYVLHCPDPADQDSALLEYRPDHRLRSWASGAKFREDDAASEDERVPPLPIEVRVVPEWGGAMIELWTEPVPLMTKRLHAALLAGGVDNLDVYPAVIIDTEKKTQYDQYLAFNLIGTVAAADLSKTLHDPQTGPMVSMDIDSLAIDTEATYGALMFRLAEAVNAIVVHQQVKDAVESAGITTLKFLPPEMWAG